MLDDTSNPGQVSPALKDLGFALKSLPQHCTIGYVSLSVSERWPYIWAARWGHSIKCTAQFELSFFCAGKAIDWSLTRDDFCNPIPRGIGDAWACFFSYALHSPFLPDLATNTEALQFKAELWRSYWGRFDVVANLISRIHKVSGGRTKHRALNDSIHLSKLLEGYWLLASQLQICVFSW